MQEIAHVASFGQGLADEGGADVQHRRLRQADVGRQGGSLHGITRAGIDEQVMLGQDALRLAPTGETRPVVRPDDEVELMRGILLPELVQRVDGVRRSRQAKLHIRGAEAGIIADGELHQSQAQVVVHQLLPFLERIAGRDDKPHLVHLVERAKPVGQRQVSDVDGIERPAEQSYPHNLLPFKRSQLMMALPAEATITSNMAMEITNSS